MAKWWYSGAMVNVNGLTNVRRFLPTQPTLGAGFIGAEQQNQGDTQWPPYPTYATDVIVRSSAGSETVIGANITGTTWTPPSTTLLGTDVLRINEKLVATMPSSSTLTSEFFVSDQFGTNKTLNATQWTFERYYTDTLFDDTKGHFYARRKLAYQSTTNPAGINGVDIVDQGAGGTSVSVNPTLPFNNPISATSPDGVTVTTVVNITAIKAQATATALAPNGFGTNVNSVVANSSASSVSPNVSSSANVVGVASSSSASALVPVVTATILGQALIVHVGTTATAQQLSPTIRTDANLTGVSSTANAISVAPVVEIVIVTNVEIPHTGTTASASSVTPLIAIKQSDNRFRERDILAYKFIERG